MSGNPYEAPESELTPEDLPPLPPRPFRGNLAGSLADYLGTAIAFILVYLITLTIAIFRGAPLDEFGDVIFPERYLDFLGLAQFVIGFSMSMLGGYLCIRISRGTNYRYPLYQAVIITLYSLAEASFEVPVLDVLRMTALNTMATLLGARIALRRRLTP